MKKFFKQNTTIFAICMIFFRPQLEYIDMIEEGITNQGYFTIAPANYRLRNNPRNVDMQFGFIMINLTNPEHFSGLSISP